MSDEDSGVGQAEDGESGPNGETESEELCRKWHQISLALIANLGMFIIGQVNAHAGAILPDVEKEIAMGTTEKSLFASLIYLGSVVGAIMTAWTTESLGRKKSILLGTVNVLIGTLLICVAEQSWMLLLGMAIGGIGFGSHIVQVPIYCNEITQPLLRPTVSTFSIISLSVGFASVHVMHTFLEWRWMLAVCCIICAISFIAKIIFLPESHIWLLEKSKTAAAKSVLLKMRGNEAVALADMKRAEDNIARRMEFTRKSGRNAFVQFLMLFRVSTFAQPFAISLVVNLAFAITGIVIINAYFVELLIEAHTCAIKDMKIVSAVVTSGRLVIAFLSLLYTKKVKRKRLLIVTLFICGLGTTVLTVFYLANNKGKLNEVWCGFAWSPVVGYALVYIGFAGGCGQTVIAIAGEILPANARGFGSGLMNAVIELVNFGTTAVVPTVQEHWGTGYVFLICTICNVALIIFIIVCVPETFGKTLEEVEQHFRDRSRRTRTRQTSSPCNGGL